MENKYTEFEDHYGNRPPPQGYPPKYPSLQDNSSQLSLETQKKPIDNTQYQPYLRPKKRISINNVLLVLLIISNVILAGVLVHYYFKANEFFDEKNELEEDYNDLEDKYDNQISKYNRLNKNYESLDDNYSKLQRDFSDLSEEYDDLYSNYNSLNEDFSELQIKNGELSDELNSLQINYSDLQNLFKNLTKKYNILNNSYNSLNKDYDTLNTNYTSLMNEYETLQNDYTGLQNEYDALFTDYNSLQNNYADLQNDYNTLQNDYNNLQLDYDDLIEYYYYQTEVLRRDRKLYHAYNPYLEWPGYSSDYPFYIEWELSSYFDSLRRDHTIDWDSSNSVLKYLENKNSFYWSFLHNSFSSSSDLANAILDIVHELEYRLDPTGIEDVRYPCETLIEGCGDCEDVSILCAAMLEGNGLDAVLIVWPEHVQAGVYLSTIPTIRVYQLP